MSKNKQKKLSSFDKEAEDLKLQLARALADYDNLQKRIEKQKQEFTQIANLKLIARLLPIYDMLVGAQKHLKDPGIAMTIKEFEDVLLQEGVEKLVSKKGDVFDESKQEVVELVEGGERSKIAEMIASGWKYKNGFIIRPERVKVYKG
jgi:molecular chaperone GrpE